VVTGRGSLPG